MSARAHVRCVGVGTELMPRVTDTDVAIRMHRTRTEETEMTSPDHKTEEIEDTEGSGFKFPEPARVESEDTEGNSTHHG